VDADRMGMCAGGRPRRRVFFETELKIGVHARVVGSARCADLARVQRASGRVPERTPAKVPSAPDTARGHRSAMPLPRMAFGLKRHQSELVGRREKNLNINHTLGGVKLLSSLFAGIYKI